MPKKPKLGSGKRFDELVAKLRGKVKNPNAVAAAIGRKKYGKIEAKLIRPSDPSNKSRKLASYVPFWA